jgi:phosphatidylglycerol lysyltransferase
VRAVADTLTAFAHGGLLRFGLETFLRGPAIVVRALSVLLVIWTVLLALPASAHYFPTRACQWGWVGFDIALAIGLFSLAYRWRQPLADIIASLVTADAVVTIVQAFVYDFPHRRGALDVVVIVIAMLAPTVAALLLWNARAHRAGAP